MADIAGDGGLVGLGLQGDQFRSIDAPAGRSRDGPIKEIEFAFRGAVLPFGQPHGQICTEVIIPRPGRQGAENPGGRKVMAAVLQPVPVRAGTGAGLVRVGVCSDPITGGDARNGCL